MTEIVRPKIQLDYDLFSTEYEFTTICRLNYEYVICGDSFGNLVCFDIVTRETLDLSYSFSDHVLKIELDEAADIWITGNDGKVIYIQREHLFECLKSNREY